MGVVLELPEGGMRAHTKGALEIVLAACDKFPSEALRNQCLAYIDLEDKFSPDDSIPVSNPREHFQLWCRNRICGSRQAL
ncbi:hypothetical protein LWI28_016881 [Acer negundo]|uniref:Uncharacterized protein n=1 Tax=Acer negundo TaxID=4023 RepID=A0AAD5IJJ8_ACENE|nr:hypothetical protein LWI28_016881 [Acer negundo]